MGLKQPRTIFGVHSMTPWNREDGTPYGIMKVLGGGNLELTGETEDLFGGSSRYPYASEPTTVSTGLTANVKAYEDFMMELFLGASVNTLVAEVDGEIIEDENVKGESVFDSADGIASVEVLSTKKDNAKFGEYILKAASATTVDLYCLTDVDFNRGDDHQYLDDSLKVAEGLTITKEANTDVEALGLRFTGGNGTIGMSTGDTARFRVLPPHQGASIIDIGSATSQFPAFGCTMLAARRSSNEIFEIKAFNCVGSGMPIPLTEGGWSISDLTIKCLLDQSKGKVFQITAIEQVS